MHCTRSSECTFKTGPLFKVCLKVHMIPNSGTWGSAFDGNQILCSVGTIHAYAICRVWPVMKCSGSADMLCHRLFLPAATVRCESLQTLATLHRILSKWPTVHEGLEITLLQQSQNQLLTIQPGLSRLAQTHEDRR
jgi:hypothetical protein